MPSKISGNTVFLLIQKNCYFHNNKLKFLGYMVLAQKNRIKNKKIEDIKI